MRDLEDLKRAIGQIRPAQLLLIGDYETEALSLEAEQCGGQVTFMTEPTAATLPAGRRFDLAIMIDLAPHFSANMTAAFLAALRDVHARRLLVLVSECHAIDLKALGFSLLAEYPDNARRFYGFELKNYKSVPDWLNSQYWANPEMWNKKRW